MVWFKFEGIYGNNYWIRSDAITYFGYNQKENWSVVADGEQSIKVKGNIAGMLAKELTRLTKSTIVEIKGENNE